MFSALKSLTGGGALSGSASSSTGSIGGDTFAHNFGGIRNNETPVVVWLLLAVLVAAVMFIGYRVFL